MPTTRPTLVVDPLPPTTTGAADRTFEDRDGGWPLRCCLRDSEAGEQLALVAATPAGPRGAYLETGPVVLHAGGCTGPVSTGYPDAFRGRDQVFRAYGRDGAIVAGVLVPAGAGQEAVALDLLARPEVDFVQSRNVLHGCYLFTMHNTGARTRTAVPVLAAHQPGCHPPVPGRRSGPAERGRGHAQRG